MDHHCPWLNNCIGFRNRKLFMLLIIYSSIEILMADIISIIQYIKVILHSRRINVYNKLNLSLGFIGLIAAIVFSFLIYKFLKYHLELVSKNTTTIEQLDE